MQAGLRACPVEVDPDRGPEGPFVIALEYAPNLKLPPHWHLYGHVEIVLKGTLYVGGRAEPPGTIRYVPANFTYGPLETRDEPCHVVEVFPVMTAEAAGGQYSAETLAEYGITQDHLNAMRSSAGLRV
jgi:hypothetical protein